ncbi:MAG: urease accessory protein UreE [Stackebrandtia sp.]
MLVETVLGNVDDPNWSQRLEDASVDRLTLDQWEAQKSRLRKNTVGGAELAISLHRGLRLRDGDVLAWDETARTATVVEIDLGEVMVVNLSGLAGADPEDMLRTSVEVGHAIGNQHWPAVVKGTQVYVPMTVDTKVMAAVMHTHDFVGVTYDFVPGMEVIAFLAPHEARKLFGGADSTPHSHAPAVAL